MASQGDEVLSQPSEFQELLQSLPIRKGITNTLLYLYDGFWFDQPSLEAVIAFQQNFEAQDTDIILVTAPKSGTTWLKSLVFAITHRFQYTLSDENHPLATNNPHGVVPFLEFIYRDNKSPHIPLGRHRLFATHLPYTLLPESIKTSKCRIIYLCRNPRDTFVSMWHFSYKMLLKIDPSWQFPSVEESLERYCEGVSLFGPFWEQILQYWKLSNERPEKVLFLKFEDLKRDIIAQCKKVADYVPWAENGLFFRKGEIGDWKNLITTSMAEKLDQLVEQKLHGSGLKLN
ncbi:hypothetical protein AQUCO_02800037v1 [Aquilegia coerulea]|uniref:Sulfotransferase n=1 Tax=Aquilegia coerulea TaxID=218851 RepID=A0A2G5D3M6_AQUCA|nr:hypothetical protein AQUCO_02800037v1 [Aquilegia coerulea]